MDEQTLRALIIEIQDYLAPRLDTYEQMLYHYLFRHSHLEGKTETTVGVRTLRARVGFGIGKYGSPPSDVVVAKKLRSLEKKKCIEILSRSSRGTQIRVLLPKDIPGIVPEHDQAHNLPPEELDFFNDPQRRLLILRREQSRCFYCMKKLTEEDYTLDHVEARANQGNNSYMNLVACCFECNARKQSRATPDFLRILYRDGLLTAEEHQGGLEKLKALKSGRLRPDIDSVI